MRTKERGPGGPNEERPGGWGHVGLLGCVVDIVGAGNGVYVGAQEQEVNHDVGDLAMRPVSMAEEKRTSPVDKEQRWQGRTCKMRPSRQLLRWRGIVAYSCRECRRRLAGEKEGGQGGARTARLYRCGECLRKSDARPCIDANAALTSGRNFPDPGAWNAPRGAILFLASHSPRRIPPSRLLIRRT